MTTEHQIGSWVYPMDSSHTPYNDTDFSQEVRQLCKEEIHHLTETNNNPINDNPGDGIEPPTKPLRAKKSNTGMSSNRLRIAKCNIVGDTSVGKTCLINRFGYDVFDSNSKATIGVDFDVQKFTILDRPFTLQIWDTAGDERFRTITRVYYRGAHAALIVFDLSTIKSFQNVPQWHQEIMDATSQRDEDQRPFLFLVGTKKDLVTEDTIKFYRQEAGKLAAKIGAEFWMVSSTTGENVNDLFKRVACLTFNRYLAREIRSHRLQADDTTTTKTRALNRQPSSQPADNGQQARFTTHNGGQVVLCHCNHQPEAECRQRIAGGGWWSHWFGSDGKIRRGIRRATKPRSSSAKVADMSKSEKKPGKLRQKTFQCFNFSCMVSVD